MSFYSSEKDVIDRIRQGDGQAMEKVYFRYRSEFVRWSRGKFGITEEDALDHYQDVLTIFFEKVMNGSISLLNSSLKTYLFGIGKNRVKQQFDSKMRISRHEEGLAEHYRFLAEDKGAELVYQEAKSQAKMVFDSLGKGCKEILRLFYFEKKSMSEIAKIMGHKSEGVSRTTKKRCLEKIRTKSKEPVPNG